MFGYMQRLLGGYGLAPHGYCLLWDPALIWTHVAADAVIGVAYFSIPVALAYFLKRRPDIQYKWVAWLFVAFILACGTTHFFSIWTLWYPDYGPEALVKVATAAISIATAVALWPLLPKLIALPSPAQLQLANADLRLRIAERDAALAALERETADRERAEAMLRQSQKMQAVGQLTGGIAHDFNNLLTIIVANLDRVRRLSGTDTRIAQPLGNALTGAERAARLTDQLLAFGRRQPLLAELQDLNEIVGHIDTLFGASLEPRIDVVSDLDPALWPVRVDGGQAENAVLNLVLNARDAMPDGGTMTLSTRNVPATGNSGDMVMIEVADTGAGMAAETRERVFEPFFTTKALGQGTGLGLSQVYGFATQSGGTIDIDSSLGAGTRVRLLLPRVESAAK